MHTSLSRYPIILANSLLKKSQNVQSLFGSHSRTTITLSTAASSHSKPPNLAHNFPSMKDIAVPQLERMCMQGPNFGPSTHKHVFLPLRQTSNHSQWSNLLYLNKPNCPYIQLSVTHVKKGKLVQCSILCIRTSRHQKSTLYEPAKLG